MATRAIKECVADFMRRFLVQLVPSNSVIDGFMQRPDKQKLAIVTGRLVDQSNEMLEKWREKGVHGAISPLPVFLIGFAKDYNSSGLEKGRSVAVQNYMVQDDQGNFFKIRLDKHDQRVQVVLYAPDHETAVLLAGQFKLFCADYGNRHSFVITEYNGLKYGFPMTLEDNQIYGTSQQIADQDNLTVLVFDLTFSCNTPYFLGDVARNQPYFDVVKTVILNDEQVQTRERFYRNIVGTPFEELLNVDAS